jgi:hypothetical protein
MNHRRLARSARSWARCVGVAGEAAQFGLRLVWASCEHFDSGKGTFDRGAIWVIR